MKIRFTHHAQLSMMERSISPSRVTEVLRKPDLSMDATGGAGAYLKKYGDRTLKVIFRQTSRGYVILTAYYL